MTGVRVEVGDEILEGNVVVEVSGRPVIVLEGPVPSFRAMKPGMRGTDIEELQASLDRLNCDTSSDEGVYGDATKECVSRMYEALGFETVPSSETEAKDLAEARRRRGHGRGAAPDGPRPTSTRPPSLRRRPRSSPRRPPSRPLAARSTTRSPTLS